MSDYLVHHGIEGQRWGRRNGPPYPLSKAKNKKVRERAKKEKVEGGTSARDISPEAKKAAEKKVSDWIAKDTIKRLKKEKRAEARVKRQEQRLIKKAARAEKQRERAEKKVEKALKKMEVEKKRIMTKGTPKEVLEFQENLTTQELKDVLDRLTQIQRLTDMSPSSKSIAKTKSAVNKVQENVNRAREKEASAKSAAKRVDDIFKGLKTVNSYMKTGVDTYNNILKVKTMLDQIDRGENKEIKKEKKEKKDDD